MDELIIYWKTRLREIRNYVKIIDLWPDNVKIYILNNTILTKRDIDYAYYMMPQDRFAKMTKLHFFRDKTSLIANELLLQFAMKELYEIEMYRQIDNTWLERKSAKYGKPYFADFLGIYYNMSHSGDYSVCAFAEREIGIDIQRKYDIDPTIAKNFFHHNEVAYILGFNEKKQLDKFFEVWVMYESFLKATGVGLSEDFSDITFKRYKESFFVMQRFKRLKYEIQLIDFLPEYKMAICKEYDADWRM